MRAKSQKSKLTSVVTSAATSAAASLWLALGSLGLVSACASSRPDAGPPGITLAITSPAPGAELLAAEHPTIVVSGTVTTTGPGRAAPEVWVNGTRMDVQAGAFMAELTPEAGVNHIKVEGSDGIDGLAEQELDVMWAPEYLAPVSGQTGFEVPGALELQLGQRFFDSRLLGTALDLSTDPVVARDLASALELVLWQVNLAGLIPGGIHVGDPSAALDITIPSATPTNIVADARIIDTPQPGIDLKIDLLGVFLAMNGSFTFGGRTLVIDGGITVDLHAAARVTLGTAADGSIQVGVTGVTATIGPLAPDFVGPNGEELDALITIGSTAFRGLIEGLLAGQLIPTFTDRVPPLLGTLLGATDKLLDNLQFTLDPGLGKPVTLKLDGRLGALDVGAGITSGHVTVREDVTLGTSGSPIHPDSRGAARLDTTADAPAFNTAGVHLTMRQDLLNTLLHALWNAGMLEGQLTSGGLSANVSARLPPIVRPTPASSPCTIGGELCDVELQLGQVEVQLPAFAQSFGINASAGARIEVDGSTVSLAIQMVPELRIWETSAMPGSLTPDAVHDLIASVVWPQLFGAIGNNLTIKLPLPDLASLGLGDLAPGLANAQLVLQGRQRPSVTAGRIILGADLSLTTPHP